MKNIGLKMTEKSVFLTQIFKRSETNAIPQHNKLATINQANKKLLIFLLEQDYTYFKPKNVAKDFQRHYKLKTTPNYIILGRITYLLKKMSIVINANKNTYKITDKTLFKSEIKRILSNAQESLKENRKITTNGNISYKGHRYAINQEFAGKTVEVQKINNGQNLTVFLNGKLITTLEVYNK